MKVKDLPQDRPLTNTAFIHPETGETVYWKSQWQNGVWFRKDLKSNRVFPLFVKDLTEALEFDLP